MYDQASLLHKGTVNSLGYNCTSYCGAKERLMIISISLCIFLFFIFLDIFGKICEKMQFWAVNFSIFMNTDEIQL